MKHQLQTIREFIESAHEGEWASYVDRDAALTALSELEAMAGAPVAKVVLTETLGLPCLQWLDLTRQFDFKGGEFLYAAPPAQQTVTNDEQASAYMDARLWEFIDMAGAWPTAKPDPRIWAHVMVYAPPAQQPQEGTIGHVSAGKTTLIAAVTPLLKAQQPQAEAVPSDVVRDAARYRFLAAHCRRTPEHWGGRWSIVIEGPCPERQDCEDAFDAAIDAAMAQGEKP